MGASANSGQDDDNGGMITEINVTPMVDIMLVLLVIFMVTASLIVSPSMKVELPKGSAQAGASKDPDVVVVVSRQGKFQYEGKDLTAEQLATTLKDAYKTKPSSRVLILADKQAYHGNVVKVMDLAKTVGFQRLGVAVNSQ